MIRPVEPIMMPIAFKRRNEEEPKEGGKILVQFRPAFKGHWPDYAAQPKLRLSAVQKMPEEVGGRLDFMT